MTQSLTVGLFTLRCIASIFCSRKIEDLKGAISFWRMQRVLLSTTMIIMVSRVSSALLPRHSGYRTCVSIWDRSVHFATTSLQVKHTEDDNRDTWQPLTRTEIRKLKLAAMREELAKRGLDTEGTRPVLMSRLLETVDRVQTKGVKKERKEKSSDEQQGCPPLDPERTYVLRIKGHSKMAYNSSGLGLVLYDAHTVREVWVARKYFTPSCSPFEADYRASILGLECAFEQGARKIVLQTDNNVLLKQVTGEYSVTKAKLKRLAKTLGAVLNKFTEFDTTHITSAENSRAKNLAQRAVATKKTIGLVEEEQEPAEKSLPPQVVKSSPLNVTPDEADDDLFAVEDEQDELPLEISPDDTYLLQFDGGARGNPGVIAGSGMVLYDPNDMRELWCGWKFLDGHTTNNAAEYYGLLLGIQCARSLGVRHLKAEGDSKLIVNHVNGSYKARHPNLKKLLAATKDAIQHLDSFEIEHIPRAANARADQLANQAMDTRESFGFDELD